MFLVCLLLKKVIVTFLQTLLSFRFSSFCVIHINNFQDRELYLLMRNVVRNVTVVLHKNFFPKISCSEMGDIYIAFVLFL